uniref:Dolichyl-diphosphooligosaccharide--protein glycosyltransferase subunit DAD1 n=1 Tax=Aegilops tauschii subsp. strangulata TaxID=200361 RepID=A0A453SXW1_AEGTS
MLPRPRISRQLPFSLVLPQVATVKYLIADPILTFLQIIDLYVFFAMVTALVQVGYMGVVGSFPFNSFLSGVLSCIGTAVLAVCLRIQVNKDNKEFKDLPPERAFADFVLCNLVLHLVIINFLG